MYADVQLHVPMTHRNGRYTSALRTHIWSGKYKAIHFIRRRRLRRAQAEDMTQNAHFMRTASSKRKQAREAAKADSVSRNAPLSPSSPISPDRSHFVLDQDAKKCMCCLKTKFSALIRFVPLLLPPAPRACVCVCIYMRSMSLCGFRVFFQLLLPHLS